MANRFDTSVKRPSNFSGERGKKFIVDSMMTDVTYSLDEMQAYFGPIMGVTFDRYNDPILEELRKSWYIIRTVDRRESFYTKEQDYPELEEEEASPVVISESTTAMLDNLLRRGNRDLKDGQWDSAARSFDKVLDLDYSNRDAQLGTLFCRFKCNTASTLAKELEKEDYTTDKQVVRLVDFFEGDELRELSFALYKQKSAKSCEITDGVLKGLKNLDDPDEYQVKIPYFTVPDGVTSIEHKYAWSGLNKCLENLTELSLPYGITEIGKKEFNAEEKLQWVYIPDSVLSIGKAAFYHSENIEMIYVPDSVTEIGAYAFCDLPKLSSIILPNNLEILSESVLSGCDALESLVIPPKVKRIENDALIAKGLRTLYLPAGLEFIHENAFHYFGGEIELKTAVIYSDDERSLKNPYAAEFFKNKYPDVEIQYQLLPKGKTIQLSQDAKLRERIRREARKPMVKSAPIGEPDTTPAPKTVEEKPKEEAAVQSQEESPILAQMRAAESQISVGNTSMVKCPRCYSYMEAVGERKGGFSGKKAAIGVAAAGSVGLLAGLFGKRKISYRCPKCGYTMEK